MAGLYIHIPFCRRKCHYCNFYSLASVKLFSPVLQAIQQEIQQRHKEIQEPLESIYFGGGTPSMLNEAQLAEIIDTIYSNYPVNRDAEITFEANPEDLSAQRLSILKKHHINRLSIGIQSFHDNELKYLNRIHSAEKAVTAIEEAQYQGFSNISIDLMYGLPNATFRSWEENLEKAFAFGIPHLSCYALTVEPGTALARFIEKGQVKNVNDELFEEQFEVLLDKTVELGYQHYEISNFCLDNKYAFHNTNYWFGGKYLGVGPSAHSYDGQNRKWNIAHLKKYIDSVSNGQVLSEQENLSPVQQYNEYVMTRLRTHWGLHTTELIHFFGRDKTNHLIRSANRYIKSGHLEKDESVVRLTRKGKFISDHIIADLFLSGD